jgi:VWFA-related protein
MFCRANRPHWTLWLVLVFAAALTGNLAAQQQQPASDKTAPDQTIQAVTEEVLLDLVVRDKKGRPVTDLKPEEIEVREDGEKRDIIAFRHVEGDVAPLPVGGTAAEARPDPLRQVNLVTLVFERLGTEGRVLARRAALDFLDGDVPENVWMSVFTIDQRLYVLQKFTKDRELLRQAVDRATKGTYTQFISESDAIRRELETAAAATQAGQGAVAGVGRGAPPSPGMGGEFAAAKLAELTLNILRYSEAMQGEQQGRASIFSLLALVREQRALAGRKTLIYFAEGLVVPPNQVDFFHNAISEANRANVSVYGVDARGLLTSGVTEATRSTLQDVANTSAGQATSSGYNSSVTRAEVMISESAEASLRANVQGTLEDLSESTGGFLTANTNDLRVGMTRVTEDIRGYYQLAYSPPPRPYDGKFRRISVKVSRPGVTLQTRSGYFALPPSTGPGPSLLPHELPLLAALNSNPMPRDFDYLSAVLHFDQRDEGMQCAVVIEAPLANFKFVEEGKKKTYKARFSLLALIKDSDGQIVNKFSPEYPLQGPLNKLKALKKGRVTFTTETFQLPPGRYTLETVALDHEASKASARRSALVVPPFKKGVGMSSVAVIRRADPLDPGKVDPANPLHYEKMRITPNLGEPIPRKPGAELALYLVIYPAAGMSEKPLLAVQFRQEGKVLGQDMPELPAPDAQGRIGYVGRLPAEAFPPGDYEMRRTPGDIDAWVTRFFATMKSWWRFLFREGHSRSPKRTPACALFSM